MNRLSFFSVFGLFLIGCSSPDISSVSTDKEGSHPVDLQIQKTVPLQNDFRIEAGRGEDFEKFKTFTLFKLSHAGKELFLDTSLTEYEFGDARYPLIRARNNGIYEILVEVNDRPAKNFLKLFKIQNDRVVSIDKLPTFNSGPSNLDADTNFEFISTGEWGELWGDNGDLTAYNPALVYEDSPEGFRLDTALTIKKNTEKYGKFYGYKYDEKVVINVKDIKPDR
jgi:hypothetical protein